MSAFVGFSSGSVSISECYVGENVTLYGKDAGAFFGYGGGSPTIDKCYSLASISASSKWGLIAECWGTRTVSNTYAAGTCISKHSDTSCQNVYATDVSGAAAGTAGVRTIENMRGKDALTNESKMPNLAGCNAFVATAGYPELSLFYETPVVANDVNRDGVFNETDTVVLRMAILRQSFTETDSFDPAAANFYRDAENKIDIADLVQMIAAL